MNGDGLETFEAAFPELVLPAFRVALRILGTVPEAEDVAENSVKEARRPVSALRLRPGPDWQEVNLAVE